MLDRIQERGKGSQGGFTLIEMAIVLIIIGLIIGAVLKGQDLITNARSKRVANFMRQGETAVWTHLDRMGYFPGDSQDNDGDLDEGDSNFYGDLTGTPAGNAVNANLENFEENLVLGSSNFNIGIDMRDPGTGEDVPVLCIVTDGGDFTEQERIYAQMLDTSIDGIADSDSGKVIGVATCGAVAADGVVGCGGGSVANWTDDLEGVCYYFDNGEE